MSGRLRSTIQGPGLHKRGRRGSGPPLFDIEAVEAVEAVVVEVSEPSEPQPLPGPDAPGHDSPESRSRVVAGVASGMASGVARGVAGLRSAPRAGLTAVRQRWPRPDDQVGGSPEKVPDRREREGPSPDGPVSCVGGGVLLESRKSEPAFPAPAFPAPAFPAPAFPAPAFPAPEFAEPVWVEPEVSEAELAELELVARLAGVKPADEAAQPPESPAPAEPDEAEPDEMAPVVSLLPVRPVEVDPGTGTVEAHEPVAGEAEPVVAPMPVETAVPTEPSELGDAGPAWLPVEPRIEERRLAVLRQTARRRMQLGVAAMCVVTAAVLAVMVVHSPLFGVRHVRIRGAVHSDLALIARTAGVDSSTPMVDVNGSAVAARLLRLPWTGTVRVTREWPATVRIQITERIPVAVAPAGPAAGGGAWALVDQTGRVLEVTDNAPAGLLRLTGVPPAGRPGTQLDPQADGALAVAASLPPDLVQQLATVGPASNQRDDPSTKLTLRRTGVVLWGSPDDAADKAIALRTVLARVDLRHVATIDVRVPLAPTVRRP